MFTDAQIDYIGDALGLSDITHDQVELELKVRRLEALCIKQEKQIADLLHLIKEVSQGAKLDLSLGPTGLNVNVRRQHSKPVWQKPRMKVVA